MFPDTLKLPTVKRSLEKMSTVNSDASSFEEELNGYD